jgi:hypothetical protein
VGVASIISLNSIALPRNPSCDAKGNSFWNISYHGEACRSFQQGIRFWSENK